MQVNIPDTGTALQGQYYQWINKRLQSPTTLYWQFPNPDTGALVIEIAPEMDVEAWFPVILPAGSAAGGYMTFDDSFARLRISVTNPSGNTKAPSVFIRQK